MERKYTVLRVVSTIFKVLAWIVLVIGVLTACAAIGVGFMGGAAGGNQGNNPFGSVGGGVLGGVVMVIPGLAGLFGAVVGFLVLYTYGDLIALLIALEENTRVTAEKLLGQSVSSVVGVPRS